ncbi:MAG: CRISPR-associated endonuclease Cas2 [bacterium]|nr:CRISPR-associated endonuclease Cas2 [bacterium]
MIQNNKIKQRLSIKILKILGIGLGITAVSILAPQLPYVLLKAYIQQKLRKPYSKGQMHNSFKYLKRKKFIAFEYKKNKIKVILTKLGRQHLNKVAFEEIKIQPIKWDGRWRLLTFDIPENKRGARQTFRRKIKEIGFFHFQRSVFIFPYPCKKEIDEMANLLEIRPFVHLITCDRFPGDHNLLKKFKL